MIIYEIKKQLDTYLAENNLEFKTWVVSVEAGSNNSIVLSEDSMFLKQDPIPTLKRQGSLTMTISSDRIKDIFEVSERLYRFHPEFGINSGIEVDLSPRSTVSFKDSSIKQGVIIFDIFIYNKGETNGF